VQPTGPVQTYLAVNGTLNYLPAFGPQTLQSAQVVSTPGGQPTPLAPGLSRTPPVVDASSAANAISQVMQVGLSSSAATSAVSGVAAAQAAPAATTIGFAFHLTGQSPSGYVTFATQADLQAYMQQLAQSATAPSAEIGAGLLGDIWSDIGDLFEDIAIGIKSATIKVYAFVVGTVNNVVNFGIQMANNVKHFFTNVDPGVYSGHWPGRGRAIRPRYLERHRRVCRKGDRLAEGFLLLEGHRVHEAK
jgi:hypothetical protein